MPRVQCEEIVPYTAAQMYILVNDVAVYPRFLPWCTAARILQRGSNFVTVECEMALAGFHLRFVTRNTLVPGQRITMTLVQGPFRQLQGQWTFAPVAGDPGRCYMTLTMEFAFRHRLLGRVLEPVLLKRIQKLAEIFRQRANALYGQAR